MTRRIKTTDLPEFDATPYLDSEEAVAAYLSDILDANDPSLLASVLGDITCARGMNEIVKSMIDDLPKGTSLEDIRYHMHVTEAQHTELDRRIEDHKANPDDVISLEEVYSSITARLNK